MSEWLSDDDPRVALPRALDAIADHVREYVDLTPGDFADPRNQAREETRRHAILEQQQKLKRLASAARVSLENASVEQFEEIKNVLAKHSFIAFKPDELSAVYDAFDAMRKK